MHVPCLSLHRQKDSVPQSQGLLTSGQRGSWQLTQLRSSGDYPAGCCLLSRRPGETESSGVKAGHSAHPLVPMLTSWD